AAAPSVASWIRARDRRPDAGGIPSPARPVTGLGFGVGGRRVARWMRDLGVPYWILEVNGATVRRAKAQGERIFYGDATSPESLHAAGLEDAVALVSMLSDPDAAERMVKTVRGMSPTIPVVVRTRYRAEADRLLAQG